MAKIEFADEEAKKRLERCLKLPVDSGRIKLHDWLVHMLCGWGWDSVCRLYEDAHEENWFGWVVFDKDGNRVMVGGLIYRDNGWESHT